MPKDIKGRSGAPTKPDKPRPDFPLFAHQVGQWAKKVRGKTFYFGPWDDPEAALAKWIEEKDTILATGRRPRKKPDGLPIHELINRFLNAKRRLVESGEIRERTWRELEATGIRLRNAFGRERQVHDLTGADFEALRAKLAERWGPVRLGNEIQRVRSIFRFGYEEGLLDHPMRFGASFRKPSRRVVRVAKAEKGIRMFEAAELQGILKAAGTPLKAMILLGVNAGFGNRDVGLLPIAAVDLKAGWLDFGRPKTGIPRRVPLWPETVKAIRETLAARPEPKNSTDSELVFITKFGQPWTSESGNNDPVGLMFRRLVKTLGIHRPGLSFYSLRHTFMTVAEGSRDLPAVRALMGHVDGSIAGAYRERIEDDRLKAVTETVRRWLFPRKPRKRHEGIQP